MNRALLKYSNQVFYSVSADIQFPETAITRLIEGIWDRYPDRAFYLLRSRIYTDYTPTPLCLASIKLAAKRVSQISKAEFDSELRSDKLSVKIEASIKSMATVTPPQSADTIVDWMNSYPFKGDRPIVAILLDQNKSPILAAINTSSKNRLLHAEVNLVRAYVSKYQKKIPLGYSVWVSLKPCCMCANFLTYWSEDGTAIRVTYLENDPGPKARTSPLTNQHIY